MRRKGIILILSCLVISTVVGCSLQNGKDNNERSNFVEKSLGEIDKENRESDSLKESEKIEIARQLFDEYINENKIELVENKEDNSKREVITFTKYKIKDIDVYEMKDLNINKNGFVADIGYDIKYTNESNRWVAGNGELKKNNWCINKVAVVNIEKINDKYVISSMGTG
ncbi:MAG: hypothetical protein ACRDAU_11905 [Clostridium sp.]